MRIKLFLIPLTFILRLEMLDILCFAFCMFVMFLEIVYAILKKKLYKFLVSHIQWEVIPPMSEDEKRAYRRAVRLHKSLREYYEHPEETRRRKMFEEQRRVEERLFAGHPRYSWLRPKPTLYQFD